MLKIVNGKVINHKIKSKISPMIERGSMPSIKGIIVHQTGSKTANSTLSSYNNKNANGAHFLIAKDGTIYQTALLNQKTWHVGKLRAKCLVAVEKSLMCTQKEVKLLKTFNPRGENKREQKKNTPYRYPSNKDAIGVEMVGQAYSVKNKKEKVYETVTEKQNTSLKWLLEELRQTFSIPANEIFRHPTVSRKNSTEAATAQW